MRKSFSTTELSSLNAALVSMGYTDARFITILDATNNADRAIEANGLAKKYDKAIRQVQLSTNMMPGGVAVEYALQATMAQKWLSGADYTLLMAPWKHVMGSQSVLS